MERALIEILACPLCKGELIYDAHHNELLCKHDRLAYAVIQGIPVMLVSRARRMSEDEVSS